MKYILRLIALPFFMVATLIPYIAHWLRHNVLFVRFGGELISYTKKHNRHSIQDVYEKLTQIQSNDNPNK